MRRQPRSLRLAAGGFRLALLVGERRARLIDHPGRHPRLKIGLSKAFSLELLQGQCRAALFRRPVLIRGARLEFGLSRGLLLTVALLARQCASLGVGLGLLLKPQSDRRLTGPLILTITINGLGAARELAAGDHRRETQRRDVRWPIPGGIGSAAVLFIMPGWIGPRILVAPPTPFLVVMLLPPPIILLPREAIATILPRLCIGGFVPLAACDRQDLRRPIKQAAGQIGLLKFFLIGRGATVTVIDHRQMTVVIAIGIARIAHQERCVRARLVIVVALAVRRVFDHPVCAITGMPEPRALALVIHRIVRRAVRERAVHLIGAINIPIPSQLGHGHGDPRGRGGRQGIGDRTRRGRRGRRERQRQGISWRRGGGLGARRGFVAG